MANRRTFLTGIAAGGAGALGAAPAAGGQTAPETPPAPAPTPGDAQRAAARERAAGAEGGSDITVRDAGSDFMVDVLKTLDLEYVAANPGSTFRGLHESLVNYGGNAKPEFVTCTHEEVSVALAHGYAKAAGKPMMALVHSNVGLQHASMAVYNAWADRVPLFIVAGNVLDETKRRPGAEWFHSAQDLGAIVRSTTKWDDQPLSLQHFADSAVRAYRAAVTPPMGPVFLALDGDLQEAPAGAQRAALRIPPYRAPIPPAGDPNALEAVAKLLAGAQAPVIVCDRSVRTQTGMNSLVALAETLAAPVLDRGGRLNFPSRHWCNLSGGDAAAIAAADVLLFLEVGDVWGSLNRYPDTLERRPARIAKADAKVVTIGLGDVDQHANNQDQQRFYAADVPIIGDSEAALPVLLDGVRRALDGAARARIAARAGSVRTAHDALRERARADATYAWDASPVAVARLVAELGDVLAHEDWALVSPQQFVGRWPARLWNFTKPYQFLGAQGAAGEGYAAPAAVGAALANRRLGRLSVVIQTDGDLMYQPGAYWTAAHHRIPLLAVMHNNRAYHQEVMHVQRMANRRQRGITNAHVGTTLTDPDINFAQMVKGLGVWTAGPVTHPNELRPALERALAVVKRGEPALVDVHTQPR